ncbi:MULTISPECIES: glycosyltransferase family 9 protein [Photorhabdus]|uniref:WalO protein n=2 Tax=Photorhabdus asymbiotica TaxID=291112 RepID=C7BT20_PHOAA|nr:walO protein [Photorhabdus asymbiotica]RKS60281.1 hypothetical protein BDD30_2431 [Photorhabdus asymbiotica]CAQ86454.1 walO protein [Photorhabdus asymbiotica]
MQIENILVIVIARFGDTLLVMTVIRALKQKWLGANIDVMAYKRTKHTLENISDINRLTAFSKSKAKWCRWFTRRHYDIALVYGDDEPLLQYAKRRSRLTVSFSDKSSWQPNWLTVKKPEQLLPAQQERAMLASEIGVEVSDWQLNYCVSEEELRFANIMRRQHPHLAVIEHLVHYMQATCEDSMSVISVEQIWQETQKLLETQSLGITTR